MSKIILFFIVINACIVFKLSSQNNQISSDKLTEVLLTFDAILVDNRVELTWATNTEHNNNTFVIEKSRDGISEFEEVIAIKNFGNYSSLISYFDVDYYPHQGISYYRLKQIDAANNVLSSRLVSINNSVSGFVDNLITIEGSTENLLGSENKEEIVVLRNEKGIESFSKVIVSKKNEIIVPENADYKLENGTYTIIASSNDKLQRQKVVVK